MPNLKEAFKVRQLRTQLLTEEAEEGAAESTSGSDGEPVYNDAPDAESEPSDSYAKCRH